MQQCKSHAQCCMHHWSGKRATRSQRNPEDGARRATVLEHGSLSVRTWRFQTGHIQGFHRYVSFPILFYFCNSYVWSELIMKCCSLIARDQKEKIATVNNITNVYPSAVFISQRQDVPDETICSADNLPVNCGGPQPCACSHVEKIPLNSAVEIILIDESKLPFCCDVKRWFNEHLFIVFNYWLNFISIQFKWTSIYLISINYLILIKSNKSERTRIRENMKNDEEAICKVSLYMLSWFTIKLN